MKTDRLRILNHRPDAPSAQYLMNFLTLFDQHNFLQVGQVGTVGGSLGETAIVTECCFLAAFFTNCHSLIPFKPDNQ